MIFPSRGHHCSPVIVLLLSRMIRDGSGWQGVRVLRRGHLFGSQAGPPVAQSLTLGSSTLG